MKLQRNCTNIYCMLATDFRSAFYSWGQRMTIFFSFKQSLEQRKIKGLDDV